MNTYISDVFFNMDHTDPNSGILSNDLMNDNAEMLITMLVELDADSCHIPTVEELKEDYFSRL